MEIVDEIFSNMPFMMKLPVLIHKEDVKSEKTSS